MSKQPLSHLRHTTYILVLLSAMAALPTSASAASAPGRPDPTALLAAQREAMSVLAFMDGVWRGPAWTLLPSGEKHNLVQTERIGPFLDGAIKVIEGRGFEADGKLSFNAFGVVSFDPATKIYSMRSHAMGRSGDYTLTPASAGSGFSWEIPAGPAMIIRYTATVTNGTWHEVGDRVVEGQPPIRFFEMTLTRVGDTGWPVEGAIGPQ